LKKLLTRAAGWAALLVAGILAAVIATASFPWHGPRPAASPRIETAARGKGPLTAGAAEVQIELPAGAPIGGFARLSYGSAGAEPVFARALVLSAGGRTVALASAEILLVPEALEQAVRARVRDLGLDGLVVAATHTHAGPGGYWEDLAGERIATGEYDPRLRDAVANAIATALRRAAEGRGAARLAVRRGRAEALVHNREGGPVDARLTVVQVDRPDGTPVGEVIVFPAHPTTLGKRNRTISGDWPGRLAAAGGGHGVRLLFQGALGDQSVRLPDSPVVTAERYAAALGAAIDALAPAPAEADVALGYARAELVLPAPAVGGAPELLKPAAATLGWETLPASADVAALRLGGLLLVVLPGEPVAEVGARFREVAGPDAEILSLAGGYVGYVETAARVRAGTGETKRSYYGPELAERLETGVTAVVAAARGTAAAPVKAATPAKAAAPVKAAAPAKAAAPVKTAAPVKAAAPVKTATPVKPPAPMKTATPVKPPARAPARPAGKVSSP
jgi:neutral ceramidase